MEKDKEKKLLWNLKGIAIISIVMAHSAYVPKEYSKLNLFISRFLSSMGTVGVGIFFIISGYLFAYNKTSQIDFLKKKFNTIVIPWLFTGTLVYIYITARKGNFGVRSYFNWIIGNGTYLYYLTVLMILYLFFFNFLNNISFSLISISFSIISLILTSFNLLTKINPYLNPLNWAIFFALGIVVNKYGLINKLFEISKKYFYLFLGVTFGILAFYLEDFKTITYFSKFYLCFEIAITMVFLFIFIKFNLKKETYLEKLGKDSFSIYLLHMPLAGIITNIFNRIDNSFLTIIRPFLIVFIMQSLINFYRYLFRGGKNKEKIYSLIGVR